MPATNTPAAGSNLVASLTVQLGHGRPLRCRRARDSAKREVQHRRAAPSPRPRRGRAPYEGECVVIPKRKMLRRTRLPTTSAPRPTRERRGWGRYAPASGPQIARDPLARTCRQRRPRSTPECRPPWKRVRQAMSPTFEVTRICTKGGMVSVTAFCRRRSSGLRPCESAGSPQEERCATRRLRWLFPAPGRAGLGLGKPIAEAQRGAAASAPLGGIQSRGGVAAAPWRTSRWRRPRYRRTGTGRRGRRQSASQFTPQSGRRGRFTTAAARSCHGDDSLASSSSSPRRWVPAGRKTAEPQSSANR